MSSDLHETLSPKSNFSYANIEQFNAKTLSFILDQWYQPDSRAGDGETFHSFSVSLFSLSVPFLRTTLLITLVGDCPHGALIFALTAIMMGMMGPRFAKFQTFLNGSNAIAKENLRGVRVGQITCRKKLVWNYRGFWWTSRPNLISSCFSVIKTPLWCWSAVRRASLYLVGGWNRLSPIRLVNRGASFILLQWISYCMSWFGFLQGNSVGVPRFAVVSTWNSPYEPAMTL